MTSVSSLFSCCSFFFSSRRRHTSYIGGWSSDVCSSDLLVTNASEAIGEGAGEIVVATRHQLVDCAMIAASAFAADGLRAGEYVCLEVRDTGGGMDRSEERRVGRERRTAGPRARAGAESW